MRFSQNGFSLVELSIVLVILGLLTGGILAGQSLIRAATLRAVPTEYQRYITATQAFRDKYLSLPGDFRRAPDFWTPAAACPGIFSTAAGGTCGGNGDGQISPSAITANELYRFWQHLALAGLIEGSYTGVPSSGAYNAYSTVTGSNAPSSKASNAGWTAQHFGTVPISQINGYFDGNYNNAFLYGTLSATSIHSGSLFNAEDAWNIDSKLDDGRPATGNVRSLEVQGGVSNGHCSSMAPSALVSLTDSVYNVQFPNIACSFIFITGF